MTRPLALVGPTASGKSGRVALGRHGPATSSSCRSTRCRCTGAWTSAPPSRRRPSRPRCRTTCIDLVDPTRSHRVARSRRDVPAARRRHRGPRPARAARRRHRPLPPGRRRRPRHPRPVPRGARPSSRPSPTRAASTAGCASSTRSRAARMEPTNRRRVVRALEVTLGSGRPFSSYGPGLDAYPPTAVCTIVGFGVDRAVLDGAASSARFDRRGSTPASSTRCERLAADRRAVAHRRARRSATGSCSPTCAAADRWSSVELRRHAPAASPAARSGGSGAIPGSSGRRRPTRSVDAVPAVDRDATRTAHAPGLDSVASPRCADRVRLAD